MVKRAILPALTSLFLISAGAAGAQQADAGYGNVSPESVPDLIRQKLASDGYKDVEIAPGSYVVSARDKDGRRVLMQITPTSMVVIPAPEPPATAQTPPPAKDQTIQE